MQSIRLITTFFLLALRQIHLKLNWTQNLAHQSRPLGDGKLANFDQPENASLNALVTEPVRDDKVQGG